MELYDDILIDAPREQVWRSLNDPQVLMSSIPGCEEVTPLSPTETQLRLQIRMGPVRTRFVGKLVLTDVRPGEGCVMNFEGSAGSAGFAKGSSMVSLETEGAGTRLRYSSQATVGGKLGQIGGRVIEASAKRLAEQFFLAFSHQLQAPGEPKVETASALPAPSAHAPAAHPSSSAMATARPRAPQAALGEGVRVLWFALGAAATAFGFWVASALSR